MNLDPSMSRLLYTTRLWGSSYRHLTSAARKHEQVQNVLMNKEKRTSMLATPELQTRYRQALINAGLSFFMVVLAAQALKSAQEKRKAKLELEAVQELLEEKRVLLHSLQDRQYLSPLAAEIVEQVQASQSWWYRASEEDLNRRILAVLDQDLRKRIGQAAMTEEERDRDDLQALMTSVGVASDEHVHQTVSEVSDEAEETTVAIKKKKVYAF